MLQLLKEKPTYLSGELGPLEQEWKRFADGAVLFEQLEPALRAHFVCTAETVMQDADAEEKEPSGLEKLTQFLPTGRGTLYILAG